MMGRRQKLPSYQFYPGDWMKDTALRACSLAARGLWQDLLCLMFESERRGHLQLNGNPMTPSQIANAVGAPAEEVSRCLQELENAGVLSTNRHGIIFSRRQVRDDRIRQERTKAGRRGGVASSKNGTAKVQQKHTSSSSSSSSSSEGVITNVITPYSPQFDLFWMEFPAGRKKSKGTAWTAWKKSIKQCSPEVLIAAAAEYAASNEGRGRYVKMPATWLNGGCWNDDRTAWARNQSEPATNLQRKQDETDEVFARMRKRMNRRDSTPLLESEEQI